MPAAGDEFAEQRGFGTIRVHVDRLGVVAPGKLDYLVFRDGVTAEFELIARIEVLGVER